MHTIRLRKPWQRQIGTEPIEARIDVPDQAWPVRPPSADTVHYRRNFNRPSGLDDSTSVSVCIASWCGDELLLVLNGIELRQTRAFGPMIVDATDALAASNVLEVKITGIPNDSMGLTGEVSLQINTGEDSADRGED